MPTSILQSTLEAPTESITRYSDPAQPLPILPGFSVSVKSFMIIKRNFMISGHKNEFGKKPGNHTTAIKLALVRYSKRLEIMQWSETGLFSRIPGISVLVECLLILLPILYLIAQPGLFFRSRGRTDRSNYIVRLSGRGNKTSLSTWIKPLGNQTSFF